MYGTMRTVALLVLLSLEGVYLQNQSEIDANNALIEVVHSCKCVKHYTCDENNTIITDGRKLIERRLNVPIKRIHCQGSTFANEIVCCKLKDVGTESSTLASTEATTVTTPLPKPILKSSDTDKIVIIEEEGTCGVQKTIINTRIYTGSEDLNPMQGEFPWIAAIFKKTTSGRYKFLCSGSLIYPNVVLTVAHCLHNKPTSDLRVVLNGKIKVSEQDATPEEKRDVSEVVNHPGYNDKLLFNDVSFLVLERPYKVETSSINTLCLPPDNVDVDLEGKRCLVAGWGTDNSGTSSKQLKKVELPFVNHTHCQALLRKTKLGKSFKLDSSFMCAGGEKGRDACTGDGGSPLMCAKRLGSNQYFVAGMVSWGLQCGNENVPGVYVDISDISEWLLNELRNRGFNV